MDFPESGTDSQKLASPRDSAIAIIKMLRDGRTAGMRKLRRGIRPTDERQLWAGSFEVSAGAIPGQAALPDGGKAS